MDRKEAIMWLKIIRANLVDFPEISNKKKIEALDMAIRSVEIDEAYQLEYEKTNELFNDLQQGLQEAIEIEKAEDRRMTNGEHLLKQYPILNEYSLSQKGLYMSCCFPLEWWNAEYSNDECNTEGVINSSFVREVLESRQAKAEDCVSRADLNQILWDYDCKNENALMVKAIAELPSVYPKSDKPSGKWEQINKNEVNVIPQWKCSECGAEFECFDMDFEYCPNCGAKMVEPQESEDHINDT